MYLELYDSETSELLARVMYPEAGRGFGVYTIQNEVTNRAAADRLLKKWADIPGDFLQQARNTGDSNP